MGIFSVRNGTKRYDFGLGMGPNSGTKLVGKGTLQGTHCLLVNVYCPKITSKSFFFKGKKENHDSRSASLKTQ